MSSHSFSSDALRFIIGGVINTAFTYVIFLLALPFSNHTIAYCISWLAGILFVVLVYPSKVFVDSNNSLTKKVAIAAQYIVVFIGGLFMLKALVEYFLIRESVSMGLTIIFTTVLNFVLMRFLLRGNLGKN